MKSKSKIEFVYSFVNFCVMDTTEGSECLRYP